MDNIKILDNTEKQRVFDLVKTPHGKVNISVKIGKVIYAVDLDHVNNQAKKMV